MKHAAQHHPKNFHPCCLLDLHPKKVNLWVGIICHTVEEEVDRCVPVEEHGHRWLEVGDIVDEFHELHNIHAACVGEEPLVLIGGEGSYADE